MRSQFPPRRPSIATLEPSPPERRIGDLETPALVVDMDRMAANLDRMASYAALHGLALRPHVKTHKAPRVAAEQMRLGAVGLTCATPRELEVMGDVAQDLFLAYPLIGAAHLARVLTLPRELRLTVAVDSAAAVDQLSSTARAMDREIDVRVELDVGMRRVGVATPDGAVALAHLVRRRPPLRYAGVTFYPGHVREAVHDQGPAMALLAATLGEFLGALSAAGVEAAAVSGGSTPAAWRMHELEGLTEVRPGTYVFNDRTTAEIGACAWEDCALTVLATVVSTAVPGQAVVDAGSKALGREPVRGADGEGWGALLERPEVTIARMSEEHGVLDLSRSEWRPLVGEQVRIVPNHVCYVVYLYAQAHGVRGEVVETSWDVERGR